MIPFVRSTAFLCLAILASAVFARAEDPGQGLFDGTRGEKLSIPSMKFQALHPGAPAMETTAQRPTSDLFYFTPEEAAEAAADYEFQIQANGYTFDSDVPAEIQKQMRADLAFINGIQGSGATPLHQEIFGKVDGAVYKEFFESRVSAIGMDDCGNGNAVACVIPFRNPSRMWLTENFVKFDHPQVSRMMVVYHEARHTELRRLFWGHATCPRPFKDSQGRDMKSIWTGALLAGQPACDKTAMGSYGSSTIMLKNIEKHCANCTAKVKMDAGLYADDQLGRIIDKDSRKQMADDFDR
ncbi:MAG: hypothetical protein HZB91_02155 [Elusimicrobia bacterium]|nr:hypothetical protein [Elusimicrobiota bacterium]